MFKTKAFALRKVRLSTQPHGAWNVRYVGDSDVFTLQYVNQFDGQRKKGNWQLLAKKWGRKRCYLNPRKGTEFQAIRHGDYIQLRIPGKRKGFRAKTRINGYYLSSRGMGKSVKVRKQPTDWIFIEANDDGSSSSDSESTSGEVDEFQQEFGRQSQDFEV